MNILHISTPLNWRGGEQQLAYLISELEEPRTHHIILCSSGSVMQEYCIQNKIDHYTVKRSGALNFRWPRRIKEICRERGIDLIHLHDAHAHTSGVLSGLLFKNRVRMVLSRKVDFPVGNSFFSQFKYNYRSIRRIICVSHKVKEVLAESIKDKNKLITIYDGIDLKKFDLNQRGNLLRSSLNIPLHHTIIGNVAAIAPHKDYFTFVNTARLLLEQGLNATFLIIGDGPERKEIENYITACNLNDKIKLLGFRNDIPAILPELDVFLMTSKTEGLGSSILDAFACKVPVVATEAGGIPEIVKDGWSGMLAPVKDASKLAAKVQLVINDSSLRNRLTANAFAELSNFSKEQMALKTLMVYQQVLKQGFPNF